jgi:hypothetical protein
MGFPDLLDPSNGPEFFGRLYRDHPVYTGVSINDCGIKGGFESLPTLSPEIE